MSSFVMVVLDVLGDGMVQGSFAEKDHAIEAFLLDRLHESFGIGVQIRAARRQGQGFDAGSAQDHVKAGGEFGVAVAEEITATPDQIAAVHRQIPRGLAHPGVGRVAGDRSVKIFIRASQTKKALRRAIKKLIRASCGRGERLEANVFVFAAQIIEIATHCQRHRPATRALIEDVNTSGRIAKLLAGEQVEQRALS
jgi:hypothetical protein